MTCIDLWGGESRTGMAVNGVVLATESAARWLAQVSAPGQEDQSELIAGQSWALDDWPTFVPEAPVPAGVE